MCDKFYIHIFNTIWSYIYMNSYVHSVYWYVRLYTSRVYATGDTGEQWPALSHYQDILCSRAELLGQYLTGRRMLVRCGPKRVLVSGARRDRICRQSASFRWTVYQYSEDTNWDVKWVAQYHYWITRICNKGIKLNNITVWKTNDLTKK